jgi:signal peptidase I
VAKLLNITRNIGVGLLILASLALLVLSMPGSGWKALSVQTGSMKPAIMPGDLVLVHSVPMQDLHIGDVITYINPANNRQTITHRVTGILTTPNGPGRFVTQGDANKAADPVVYQNQIIGQVKHTAPNIGFLLNWLRSWVGLIVVVYVPALFMVIAEIKKLSKYYKELEPYVASGFNPKRPHLSPAKQAAKAGTLAVATVLVAVVPSAQAAFISEAVINNNTISSTASLDHLVISKVTFGGIGSSSTNVTVSNNNSQTATSGNATVSGNGGNATTGNASNTNTSSINFSVSNGGSSPAVTIYNPADSPVAIAGWTLVDNTSVRNLPATTIAANESYVFTWPQANGLDKLGDRLILRNTTAATVDAISWGADMSQINPAIAINAGTVSLVRTNPNIDSDSAADWQAS